MRRRPISTHKHTFTQSRIFMLKKRYYYDPKSCTYVEDKWGRLYVVGRGLPVLLLALALAVPLLWVVDWLGETPQEVAQKTENAILREAFEGLDGKLDEGLKRMDAIEEQDHWPYRQILGVEPISEDVRRVGVGGSDPYEEFDRLAPPIDALVKETAQRLDQLTSRIELHIASSRDLLPLAQELMDRLHQTPMIPPSNGKFVSGFGMRPDPFLGVPRMHYGVDILSEEGTPVVASADGQISRRGYNAGYGNYVIISHPASGTETLYAHLSAIDDTVRRGRRVDRGERIGLSGNTGRSVGPHVHFEIRNQDGDAVNPLNYLSLSMTPAKFENLKADSERATPPLDSH